LWNEVFKWKIIIKRKCKRTNENKNCKNCMFKGKCGKDIIDMHHVGIFTVLMMGKMLKGESSTHEMLQ
jgi:hypothetical protein